MWEKIKMMCEVCNKDMVPVCRNSVQGWSCPNCGWGVLTTYIDEIYQDMTEYCVYVKNTTNVDKNKIKVVSQIAGVNYRTVRQMLASGDVCVLKAKAPEIKNAIDKLQEAEIPFEVTPEFGF